MVDASEPTTRSKTIVSSGPATPDWVYRLESEFRARRFADWRSMRNRETSTPVSLDARTHEAGQCVCAKWDEKRQDVRFGEVCDYADILVLRAELWEAVNPSVGQH